jgi:hypothetical protein
MRIVTRAGRFGSWSPAKKQRRLAGGTGQSGTGTTAVARSHEISRGSPARLARGHVPGLVLALLAFLLMRSAAASPLLPGQQATARDGDDRMACETGPPAADYRAWTESGVPLNDPYAVRRGEDQGLVSLMNEGGRRVRTYVVPRQAIRGIVRVAFNSVMPDRADLLFEKRALVVVYTTATNAGIFTVSDVFRLPLSQVHAGALSHSILAQDAELPDMVKLGLTHYPNAPNSCF